MKTCLKYVSFLVAMAESLDERFCRGFFTPEDLEKQQQGNMNGNEEELETVTESITAVTYDMITSEQNIPESRTLTSEECRVLLVRQTGIDKYHISNDDLVGTDVYGTTESEEFSILFDYLDVETFISTN